MITQWLSRAVIDDVGEVMYAVSLLACLAVAWRMAGIWRRWGLGLAGGIVALSLIFALYWLYCIVRIEAGCLLAEPTMLTDAACRELAWWARLGMAGALTAVAAWLWREG
jgi:hypothetical protein